MKQADVMVVGVGGIGGSCLELLAREHTISKLVASDVRENYGSTRLNMMVVGANQMGYYPESEFIRMDLLDSTERNAEIIAKVNPRCILNCTTMVSWWVPDTLPPDVVRPLKEVSAIGPYIAFHLRLVYHLMLAVKASGINPYVVNGSFPDGTSPALKTQGLAPTVGMGNLDNMGARLKKVVADKEGVKFRDVLLYLVAHHFNNVWFGEEGMGPPPPYFIKICIGDKDVTPKYNTFDLLKSCAYGRIEIPMEVGNMQIASSTCKHALALLNDSRILTLSPSPGGIVGGYPVRLGADGAKICLPDEITTEEALRICLEGQKREGIDEIRDDGTIVFTDGVYEGLKKVYNFNCKSFNIRDVDAVATEQLAKFKKTLAKYHKEMPRMSN